MSNNLKGLASMVLSVPARLLLIVGTPLTRLWNHARMSCRVAGTLDPSVVVLGLPEIHGTGNICVGKRLHLYRELYLETQDEGVIELGDDVVISRGTHIVAFNRITIGAGSMIGEYCSIRDANHRFGEGVTIRDSGHTSEPITIGSNVWIGRGVAILPGVTIEDYAVVGANAVVTRNVARGAIVAGVPAKPMPTKEPK